MSVLISQSVINYVEEENIPALKALLEKCKDVDERNEVRLRVSSSHRCALLLYKVLRVSSSRMCRLLSHKALC